MPKTIEDSFTDWEAHVFGYGYGTGEKHIIPALKTFLAHCTDRHGNGSRSYDHEELGAKLGAPVAWLLINALCHADVIEYGTSPRYGWLTEHGRALKEFVDGRTADELLSLTARAGTYIHCYPDACSCGPNGYEAGRKCNNPFWR